MRRLLKGPLALFCLACCAIASAADVTSNGGEVVVNGVTVLRLKASVGGMSAADRAKAIASSLNRASDAEPIRTEKKESEFWIYVGDRPCVTVTKGDARADKSTLAGLARDWASQLGVAMALPPLRLESNSLEVPINGERTIRLIGSMARKATLKFDNGIAKATYESPTLTIRGSQLGQANLTIDAGGYVETLAVTVRPYAADLPQTLYGEVAGAPAASTSVGGAIETAIHTQLKAKPYAKVEFKLPKITDLPIGEARAITVPVRISANDVFTAEGNVVVTVRNVPISRVPDAELWYSNNPETVRKPQALFSANLRQGAPARLLYHHVNATDFSTFLRVQLVNASDQPARVMVMPGDTPPDKNPVRAGLVAARQYFEAWMQGSGEVVTVPPRCTLPVTLRKLAPGQTSSGLCGIRLIDGPSSVLVRTDMYPPFPLDSRWEQAIASTTPWREVGCPTISEFDTAPYTLSEHIYPNPQKQEEVRYEVGGRYGFVRIGQRAIPRLDQNSRLEGNFGVIYNIKGEVVNPTTKDTDIEVVFEASAGYSGGLFALNGVLVKTGLIQPKGESQITKFKLPAGQSRSINFFTIPLSGSSYPATITIRPVLKSIR